MTDLTEESMFELMKAIHAEGVIKPSQLVVTQEGIERMRGLCDGDPEFKKRVLAEFPQMEALLA